MSERSFIMEKKVKKLVEPVTIGGKVEKNTGERFHNLLEKMGFETFNQQSLEKIIEVVEEKYIFKDKEKYEAVLKSFDQYVSIMRQLMLGLVDNIDTSEERIRTEYIQELEKAYEKIAELEQKLEAEKYSKGTLAEQFDVISEENQELKKRFNDANLQMERSEKALEDQRKLSDKQEEKIYQLESEIKSLKEAKVKLEKSEENYKILKESSGEKIRLLEQALKDSKRDASESVKEAMRKAEKEKHEVEEKYSTKMFELIEKNKLENMHLYEKYDELSKELLETKQRLADVQLKYEREKKNANS